MMRFLKKIFTKPLAICFALVAIIIGGVSAALQMPMALLPEMSLPFLTVMTTYVGASSETIEEQVSTPLLQSIKKSITNIESVESYSLDNASLLLVQFSYGVELAQKQQQLEDQIGKTSLPSACGTPLISRFDLNSLAICNLSLFSATDSLENVYFDAVRLQEELKYIPGVGDVTFVGAPSAFLSITPIPGLESVAPLIVKEIGAYLQYDIPLGEITIGDQSISITNQSAFTSIDALRKMPLTLPFDAATKAQIQSLQDALAAFSAMTSDDMKETAQAMNAMKEGMMLFEETSVEELTTIFSLVQAIKALERLLQLSPNALQALGSTIKTIVENPAFQAMNEEELRALAESSGISYEILRWVQQETSSSGDGVTAFDEKWKLLVAFRMAHQETIAIEDQVELYYTLGFLSLDPSDPKYMEKTEAIIFSQFASRISSQGFTQCMAEKKQTGTISDESFAMLFFSVCTKKELAILSFVQSEAYETQIQKILAFKKAHEVEVDGVLIPSVLDGLAYQTLLDTLAIEGVPPLSSQLIDCLLSLDTTQTNMVVTLEQIADVAIRVTQDSLASYQGYPSIQLQIFATSGSNVSDIVSQVEKTMQKFLFTESQGQIVMLDNQASFINESVSNALSSLCIGAILAVAIIYLFLRKVRSSFIIAISMPISVFASLICLSLFNITLNMVSIGGLAVGIGMLVDNSIVVLESITTEKEKGKRKLESAVEGTRLVIGSLIGSTLTSICVFFPILFMSGLTKEIFADLAWAVIFSLSFSLLVALIVIPTLFCLFDRDRQEKPKRPSKFAVMERIKRGYDRALKIILKRKIVTFLVAIGLFIGSLTSLLFIGSEFLPPIDQHRIEVSVTYALQEKQTTCVEKTQALYTLLENEIETIDTMSMSVKKGGIASPQYVGTILLDLDKQGPSSTAVVSTIRSVLKKSDFAYPVSVVPMDGVLASLGMSGGTSISILGEEVSQLETIAEKVQQNLMRRKEFTFVKNSMMEKSTRQILHFDYLALAKYGIDYATLVLTLRIGLAGYDVMILEDDGNPYQVNVSFNEQGFIDFYGSLEQFVVGRTENGESIRLSQVASIEEKTGLSMIKKQNGLYVVDIMAEVEGLASGEVAAIMQNEAKAILKAYPGYQMMESGTAKYLTDAFQGLFIALCIAFVLLYSVMSLLFKSIKKPLIVLCSFPFAFAGGFLALLFTQVSLNVVSFIGLIMLMGVIVNNAIVLIERIAQLETSGLSMEEAIHQGTSQRLRAVFMTTLTTVLALLPVALGIGQGGELMQPLGIVSIGGLIVGTFVTLGITPLLYAVISKTKRKKNVAQ